MTEYRAHSGLCPYCQTVTSTPFPEGVTAPAQYGAQICAFVVYLLNYYFLPEDRLMELLSDSVGLKCSADLTQDATAPIGLTRLGTWALILFYCWCDFPPRRRVHD